MIKRVKQILIIISLLSFCQSTFGQVVESEKTLKGHKATVLSLDIDRSGKYMISGSYDTDVILWDYLTGEQLSVFNGHNSGVWNVKISPDEKYVASGSWDNNMNAVGSSKNCLNMLDSKTLKLVKSLSVFPDRYKTNAFIPELDRSASNGISDISFNTDATKIAARSRSGNLFVWDMTNNYKEEVYRYRESKHVLLALSDDWKYVACKERKRSMVDSTFYLMKFGEDEIIAKFDNPRRSVIEVQFSSDSKYIASISGDRIKRNEIDVWDLQTRKLLFTLNGHTNVIRSLAFSKNNKFLASAAEDNLINLWNLQTGKLTVSFSENNLMELTSVLFSPDQKYLISASQDKTIKYWDIGKWTHEE